MYLYTHIRKTFFESVEDTKLSTNKQHTLSPLPPPSLPGKFPSRKKLVWLAGIIKSERGRFQSLVDFFAGRSQRLSFARIRASYPRISALRIHDVAPRRTSALR